MARPRVFVSSTFYDLKQVRTDLQAFINQMGYDAVLHERGNVPYGSKERLESYCYREINLVEILVSVIGGRFGSAAVNSDYSVSQQEFKTAYEQGIQVYIFVEAGVWSEYRTYLKNKGVSGFQSAHVDNLKVYTFLEELEALPNNNAIMPFETAADITRLLREQWGGLFQRFLRDEGRAKETSLLKELQANMQTLNELITFLTEEKRNSSSAIQDILLSNHPAFPALKKVLVAGTPVFFRNSEEMGQWMKAYGWEEFVIWGDEILSENIRRWTRTIKAQVFHLNVARCIFDDNDTLKIFTPSEWRAEWITRSEYTPPIGDDDVPF